MPFDGINYPSGGFIYPIHAHPNALHAGTVYSQTLINAYAKCREPRILCTLVLPFTALGDPVRLGGQAAGNLVPLQPQSHGSLGSGGGETDIAVARASMSSVTGTGATTGSLWSGFVPYVPEHVTHLGAQLLLVTATEASSGQNRLSIEVTDGTSTDVDAQDYPFPDTGDAPPVLSRLEPVDILTELDTVTLNRSLEWDIRCRPMADESKSATTYLAGAVVYTVSLG